MYLATPKILRKLAFLNELDIRRLSTLTPWLKLDRFSKFGQCKSLCSSNWPSSSLVKAAESKIGIFWDLKNRPPNSVSPFEAANKLKRAVSSIGVVRYIVAYANGHAFNYVLPTIKEHRIESKVLNLCRVCSRKFNTNEKLIKHFELHKRENQKRLNEIEHVKGKKRVNLVGKYAIKKEKYEFAFRDILTPKVGYGLAEDLKRAGFWVKMVSDKPQMAEISLRNHIVDMMDHKCIECVVLVSDDKFFVRVFQEARERCVKTVVVSDNDDGILKRNADASFSWREVLSGKAKNEAVSVVGRWKDREIMKRLEWSYNQEAERDIYVHRKSWDHEHDWKHDSFSWGHETLW